MYYFSTNYRCETVLWLIVTIFILNCGTVLTQPPHDRAHHHVRDNNNRDHSSDRKDKQFPFQNNPNQHEGNERQNFPFGNNPGQQIIDRIKSNLQMNSNFQFGNQNQGNLGKPFANNLENIAKNTYNILNKTLENLNKFSNGNFGNFNKFISTPKPNFSGDNGEVMTPPPTLKPTVPEVLITTTTTKRPSNNNEEQNNFKTTTSKSTNDNVSHYIEGFPVIPLNANEIRK